MHAAPDNPDVKATMHEQAQTVGLWEEKHYLPAINRYTDRFTDADTFYIKQYVTPERMAERYEYAKEELERAEGRPLDKVKEQTKNKRSRERGER